MKSVSAARRFLRREHGSATIEAVLWIPLFVAFFALVADASFLFFGQNRAYRIVQDANREYSVGRLHTPAEVEALVIARLGDIGADSTVVSANNSGTITTSLTVPARDLVAIGLFTALDNVDINVTASQFVEY